MMGIYFSVKVIIRGILALNAMHPHNSKPFAEQGTLLNVSNTFNRTLYTRTYEKEHLHLYTICIFSIYFNQPLKYGVVNCIYFFITSNL